MNETDYRKIFDQLNTTGIVVIENFFSDSDLEYARKAVHEKITEFSNGSISLVGNPRIVESEFDRHGNRIEALLQNIGQYEPECLKTNKDLYEVVRIIAGDKSADSQSHAYHFDSHLLTALFPIVIPMDSQNNGDLILLPNIRSAKSGFITNLLQKTMLQNPVARWVFSKKKFRDVAKAISIPLVPGNLYIFWGYRTYHGNLPISAGKIRATALYHMYYRHYSNPVLKFGRWRRKKIDSRRREEARLKAS